MEAIAPLRAIVARVPSPAQVTLPVPTVAEPCPPGWLTAGERRWVYALGQRDQEVRREESKRLTASGVWTQVGVDYEYRVGPDGRRYAVRAHPGMVAASAPQNQGRDEGTGGLAPALTGMAADECLKPLDLSV